MTFNTAATITYLDGNGRYWRAVTPRTRTTYEIVGAEDEDFADAVIALWLEKTEQEKKFSVHMWTGYGDQGQRAILEAAGLLGAEAAA